MRWLFVLSAGCSSAFGLDQVGPFPDAAPTCLADDFSDGQIDTNRWTTLDDKSPQKVQVTNGHLEITLTASSNGYNGLVNLSTLDFTAGVVQAHVTPAAETTGVETYLRASSSDGRRLVITTSDSMLTWAYAFDDGPLHPTPRPFDPAGDAYWRISHAVDRFTFDTSADGVAWSPLGTIVHSPMTFQTMTVTIAAGEHDGGAAAPGTAQFDDVRFVNGACP